MFPPVSRLQTANMKSERHNTGSWIWLALLAILLCAATLHGQHLIHHAAAAETNRPGTDYADLPAFGDQAVAGSSTVFEDQTVMGMRIPVGKISRIYAAMMKAKVQELEV